MLLLQYDPLTTELIFREQPLPPVTANLGEFNLTTNLQINAGTITVNGHIDFDASGKLQIEINGIIEVL